MSWRRLLLITSTTFIAGLFATLTTIYIATHL